MKSIMEQASSIMKAIEKAWMTAENPKEFSVKIFEKEEKNFFGMTTKPAKIGIFFSDKNYSQQEKSQKNRSESSCTTVRPTHHDTKPVQEKRHDYAEEKKHIVTQQPSSKSTKPLTQAPHKPTLHPKSSDQKNSTNDRQKSTLAHTDQSHRTPASWNDTMISTTTTWIRKTLPLIGMNDIEFNVDIAGKNLKLTFNKPLIENPIVEKQLFRSIAHLIMSSLRNQYKQEIKDLKVVLIRPQ